MEITSNLKINKIEKILCYARLSKKIAIKLAGQPEHLAGLFGLGPTCPVSLPGVAWYC